MSRVRSPWIFWALALAALFVVAGLLARGGGLSGASSLSPAPDGLLGARAYLERRGSRVRIADAPLARLAAGDAVVLAFPMNGVLSPEEVDALRRGVSAGGTLVIAYSGRPRSPAEHELLKDFGLAPEPARGAVPLQPWRWWAFARATWRLVPDASLGAGARAREIEIRAPEVLPRVAADATVLYRGEREKPAVFLQSHGRGRLVVLPANAISNERLALGGSVDLLESLRASVSGAVIFDEYHHGWSSSRAAADSGSAHSLDLLLAELVLIYLAAALALGRRFGPSWEEPVEISGSSATFLLGLGALHHRLRHGDEAGSRLLDAAGRLDSRMKRWASSPVAQRLTGETGEAAFLDLARAVGRSHRNRRYT